MGNRVYASFTADKFTGDMIECNEGDLCGYLRMRYIILDFGRATNLFRLLDENLKYFTLKLRYEGEKLVEKTITRY